MLKVFKSMPLILPISRPFKNFGHKRQPVPTVTILWHGFLTFTFIGCGIEWKRIARYLTGEEETESPYPWETRAKRLKLKDKLETTESNN